MIPDLTNGLFEALGAVALWGNVRAIRESHTISGVDWRSTVFFTAWGIWNLYYYPHLDQWLSFAGGLAIVVVNATWLAHVWAYRSKA
jgi:hypothetical protein